LTTSAPSCWASTKKEKANEREPDRTEQDVRNAYEHGCVDGLLRVIAFVTAGMALNLAHKMVEEAMKGEDE
jgi:hypothetical protein